MWPTKRYSTIIQSTHHGNWWDSISLNPDAAVSLVAKTPGPDAAALDAAALDAAALELDALSRERFDMIKRMKQLFLSIITNYSCDHHPFIPIHWLDT
jgi:hypothetical protein